MWILARLLASVRFRVNIARSTSSFRLPKTASEDEICCLRAVPKSTKYKNKWSVKTLEEWQLKRTVKVPVLDVTGIFKDYDVAKVQSLDDVSLLDMDAHSLNYWLANFNSCTVNFHFKSQTNNNNNTYCTRVMKCY